MTPVEIIRKAERIEGQVQPNFEDMQQLSTLVKWLALNLKQQHDRLLTLETKVGKP